MTVTDNQSVVGAAAFQDNVAEVDVVATASSFTAVLNQPFSNQVVATFTDPAGAEPNSADPNGTIADHYTASIYWGDFSFPFTDGTITFSGGVFTVTGSHTYFFGGFGIPLTTQVTINHEGSQVTVFGTATVNSPSAPPGGHGGAGAPDLPGLRPLDTTVQPIADGNNGAQSLPGAGIRVLLATPPTSPSASQDLPGTAASRLSQHVPADEALSPAAVDLWGASLVS